MKTRPAAILLVLVTTCLGACSDDGTDAATACATGCHIDDVCHADGDISFDNPCLHCDTSVSSTAWTDNDGASCSDGLFCTEDDVCSGGTCGGSARDCSDGVDCTGEETCDEDGDTCVAGTTTCGDFSYCDVATDTCTTTCTNGCVIDGACYGAGQVNPLNPCQVCDPSAVGDAGVTDWADNDGEPCDDGIFCNGDDTCSAGACVSSGDPCAGGQDCLEDEDLCCTPGVAVYGPVCNAAGDVVALDDCGDEIPVEDCIDSTLNGACENGACGCADGFAGIDCATCVVYVNGATGDNSNGGGSWSDAFATVQAGLNAAGSRVSSGGLASCEVWVAQGTYVPTSGSGRAKTIRLEAHVALCGGFAGIENLRSERDIELNPTILSGDLDGDGDTSDNAYHVVTGVDYATIDGFTITGGNANGGSQKSDGGGMYNYYESPTVTNCTFAGNKAASEGGGMNNEYSSPTVTDCTFVGNEAGGNGGGMSNNPASPTVTSCTFSGNSARYDGAGMVNYPTSSPTVTDCAFVGNDAGGDGGGVYSGPSSSPTVTDCTFSGNESNFGGGMYNYSAASTVTNCTFSGNESDYGGGMTNDAASPVVTNCTFSANIAGNSGGGIYNYSSSPVFTNCIFWGDSAGSSGQEFTNYHLCSPTVTYSIVEGGYSGVGNLNADPLFVSSTDLRLQSGSPAIDVGDDTAVPAGVTTDLDGNPRFACDAAASDAGVDAGVDGGATGCVVDMGAYEYQP